MANDPMTEFSKMLERMAVPGVDLQAMMSLQQKNLEALQLANKTMMEGFQLVLRREIEIARASLDDAMKTMQDLVKETDPSANARLRFDVAKNTVEKTLANLRELSELAQKSNEEAFSILNQRTLESFDEVKAAMAAKTGRG